MLTILHPKTHKPARLGDTPLRGPMLQDILPMAKRLASHNGHPIEIAYLDDGIPAFRVLQDGTVELVPMSMHAIEIELPVARPGDEIFHSYLEL